MSDHIKVTVSDDELLAHAMADDWLDTQNMVQSVCTILLSLDTEKLQAFIQRGESSLTIVPIPTPSEFPPGVDKLKEVLAHARVVLAAQEQIIRTMMKGG